MMTRREYVAHLRALYLAANSSDGEDKPDWMRGDECGAHCQPYDRIARHMGLGENWLEED